MVAGTLLKHKPYLRILFLWDFIPNIFICQEKMNICKGILITLIDAIDIDALSIMKLETRKGTIATASSY